MERMAYDPAFEQVWKAYGRVPNQSKVTAAASWDKAKKIRALPELPQILVAIGNYRQWLDECSGRGKAIPQAHFATWLNQRRWESWLPEPSQEPQEASGQASVRSCGTWPPDIQAVLQRQISAGEWSAWLAPASFQAGPPPAIICPSKLFVGMLEARYRQLIDRAISPDTKIAVSL